MINEENYLKEKAGRENPFKVPEGYFDTFAEQLMAKLPEREADVVAIQKKPQRQQRHVLWYAAACIAAVLLSSVIYISVPETSADSAEPAAGLHAYKSASDTYVEQAADYAMVDNSDIYAYLMSE